MDRGGVRDREKVYNILRSNRYNAQIVVYNNGTTILLLYLTVVVSRIRLRPQPQEPSAVRSETWKFTRVGRRITGPKDRVDSCRVSDKDYRVRSGLVVVTVK